jgi:hypothetical protein
LSLTATGVDSVAARFELIHPRKSYKCVCAAII